MTNAMTGESHTIQLRPRPPLTVADVEAELAERKAEGALIDPANCTMISYYVDACDIYGLFDVPDEWQCAGKELFVRTCLMAIGCGSATCRKKPARRSPPGGNEPPPQTNRSGKPREAAAG
jgi:hypothetical protein